MNRMRYLAKARNEFIGIEHLSYTEIERIREQLEREAISLGTDGHGSKTVDRLLLRR